MYNSVTLIGNLGQAPESRLFDNGSSCCRISLATSNTWKDKNGDKQTTTQWHNVVLWGKLGEIAQQYLSKGSKVMIVGEVTYRKDEASGKKYTDIKAREMKMLDARRDDNRFPSEAPPKRAASSAAVQNTTAAQFPDEPVAKATDDLPF